MIILDDKYIITADENNYRLEIKSTIQETTSKNYGKEITTVQGYYSTIESALNGYIKARTRKYISQETQNTLDELLKEIEQYKKVIEDKFKKV